MELRCRLGLAAVALPPLVAAVAGLVPATGHAGPSAGFGLGVTAGEVKARSAQLWARSATVGRVRAEVATDRRFRRLVATARRRAKPANDRAVRALVRGLVPDRLHHYRWCAGRGAKRRCARGRFRTAPKPGRARPISFAVSGDTDGTRLAGEAEPFHGSFEVLASMRRERNHFNVHLGDTMYSDSGVGGRPPALTVEEKWAKYRENLREARLRKLRRATGFYSHWDDHEFINDFSIPEFGRALYNAGLRAFRDYAPVAYSRATALYRRFRWGRNLELFFLDQRSFRSAKASAGGACDNPDTGAPDLAPTAPQSTRDQFALLIPSFAQPVAEACKDEINGADRTLLGERQLKRFLRQVARSRARWKIVISETPIQQFYGLPYDRWEGYAFERLRLLNQLEARGVERVTFLSTDTHAAFANVVRKRTLAGDVAPANAPAEPTATGVRDFVSGPVATNTFWRSIDSVTGAEGNGELLSAAFFKPAPPNGVGMLCAQGGAFNYAQVQVTRKAVRIAYRDENGAPLRDVDGERCGPYRLTG